MLIQFLSEKTVDRTAQSQKAIAFYYKEIK
jgi:hypothetical protein